MILMVGAAFAQTAALSPADADNATVTVGNPALGETYSIVKLFDATVTGDDGGSIAYQGDIPSALSTYFVKDASTGEITATDAAKDASGNLNETAAGALKTWATSQTKLKEVVSDGTELEFTGLPYGYYIVLTTQGAGAVTVTSTNPAASVIDKNITTPNLEFKKVNGEDSYNAKIGETVTYTVGFTTANYTGTKKIVEYTIHDTLPEFLGDVTVTSIVVDNDANTTTTEDQVSVGAIQFNTNKKIVIPWVNNSGNHLYSNGARVVITYTAKILDGAQIAGEGNTNEVDLSWKDDDDTPHEDEDHEDATVTTYGFALKKVSDQGVDLSGAVFELPFYVKATAASDGAYIYAFDTLPATFEDGDSAANYTKTLTTPTSGEIVVKGLLAGTSFNVTETQAPNGFNKLANPLTINPEVLTTTTTHKEWKIKDGQIVADSVTEATTVTYDNQNLAVTPYVVINNTGTELPSTGGIGTTIFYIVGGLLLVGAAVILVARRKAHD
jgi:fimbrial isopeptide formation D2 family protein/LPXTG-motif cell wall-anchored protein